MRLLCTKNLRKSEIVFLYRKMKGALQKMLLTKQAWGAQLIAGCGGALLSGSYRRTAYILSSFHTTVSHSTRQGTGHWYTRRITARSFCCKEQSRRNPHKETAAFSTTNRTIRSITLTLG